MDMLYLALFPGREGNLLNKIFFEGSTNRLAELLPKGTAWADAVRVIDMSDGFEDGVLRLNANTIEQEVVCYLEHPMRNE
jgi:hypothetical protein